jgi:hypothetical protein
LFFVDELPELRDRTQVVLAAGVSPHQILSCDTQYPVQLCWKYSATLYRCEILTHVDLSFLVRTYRELSLMRDCYIQDISKQALFVGHSACSPDIAVAAPKLASILEKSDND